MIKAKCTNCKYQWETESDMIKVSCPSCGDKVKIRELPSKKQVLAEIRKQ